MIIINGNIVADGKDSSYVCSYKQVRGNGKLVTQTRNVDAFSGIRISGQLQGYLKLGSPALQLTVDENLLPLIETRVRNGILDIRNADPETMLIPSKGARIDITAPRLTSIAAHGAASLRGESAGPSMSLEASGAGLLELALKVEGAVTATASGASRTTLSGEAPKVVLIASGTSKLDSSLASSDAEVKASGTAQVRVHATKRVHITASGAASVIVVGNPPERGIEKTGLASVAFEK